MVMRGTFGYATCFFLWLVCFLPLMNLSAQGGATVQQKLKGKNIIRFNADYVYFSDVDFSPYIEVLITADASSLTFRRNADKKWQALAEMRLKIEGRKDKTNDGDWVQRVFSPTIADTAAGQKSFYMMHSFRIPVQSDSLKLTIEIKDLQLEKSSVTGTEMDIWVPSFAQDSFSVSEILFLDQFKRTEVKNAFSRHGYDAIPLVNNSFYENKDTLRAYFEMYRAGKLNPPAKRYKIHAFISDPNLNRPIGKLESNYVSKPIKDFDINVVSFDIKDLVSNSYMLVVELKDETGRIFHRMKKLFYVSNMNQTAGYMQTEENEIIFKNIFGLTEKDLDAVIPKLQYISTENEISFAKSLKDYEMKKNYFVNFWRKRMTTPGQPAKEWEEYLRRIKYANDRFRGVSKDGWRSDRGRILLTYGAPSDIQAFPVDHDKVPYEIWTFNRIKAQTGVIFVFADLDLATGAYPLIHSTLTGEIYNANWRNNVMQSRERDYNFNGMPNTPPDNFKDNLPGTSGSPR